MQQHVNAKLPNNNTFYYAQLYFYDLVFAVEQPTMQNFQLNPVLLHQLIDILYNYNPYIRIYRTADEKIQLHTNCENDIFVILNLWIRLLLKIKTNK